MMMRLGILFLKYIMGIAQNTPTVYWYVDTASSQDPFLQYLIDVSSEASEAKVHSISWSVFILFITDAVITNDFR